MDATNVDARNPGDASRHLDSFENEREELPMFDAAEADAQSIRADRADDGQAFDVASVDAPDVAAMDVSTRANDAPPDAGEPLPWTPSTTAQYQGSASAICGFGGAYDASRGVLYTGLSASNGTLDVGPGYMSSGSFNAVVALGRDGAALWTKRVDSMGHLSAFAVRSNEVLVGAPMAQLAAIEGLGSPISVAPATQGGLFFGVNADTQDVTLATGFQGHWEIRFIIPLANGDVALGGLVIGTLMIPGAPPSSGTDIYSVVAVLGPDGRARWTRTFVAPGAGTIAIVQQGAMDADGNLYVTGYAQRAVDFGDGTIEEPTAALRSYGFVASYGPDGSYRWHRILRSNDGAAVFADLAIDLRTTPQRIQVSGGTINGTTISGPGFSTVGTPEPLDANSDMLWATFETDGRLRRVHTIRALRSQIALHIAAGPDPGDVLITGSYVRADFDPFGPLSGTSSVFVLRSNEDATVTRTAAFDATGFVYDRAIATNADRTMAFVVGCVSGAATFDGRPVSGTAQRAFVHAIAASPRP